MVSGHHALAVATLLTVIACRHSLPSPVVRVDETTTAHDFTARVARAASAAGAAGECALLLGPPGSVPGIVLRIEGPNLVTAGAIVCDGSFQAALKDPRVNQIVVIAAGRDGLVGSHPSGPGSHSLAGMERRPIDPARRVIGMWNNRASTTPTPALPVLQQIAALTRFLLFVCWELGPIA
jgi:hypothetical protein